MAIGANAVVFAILDGLILHPLNVPRSESLYSIERPGTFGEYQSYPDYVDLRDRNRSFESLIAFSISEAGLDTGNNPVRAWLYDVSANYFDGLELLPYSRPLLSTLTTTMGRTALPTSCLHIRYWHSHFQDDRGVVGRVVNLNKHPFTDPRRGPAGVSAALCYFLTPISSCRW